MNCILEIRLPAGNNFLIKGSIRDCHSITWLNFVTQSKILYLYLRGVAKSPARAVFLWVDGNATSLQHGIQSHSRSSRIAFVVEPISNIIFLYLIIRYFSSLYNIFKEKSIIFLRPDSRKKILYTDNMQTPEKGFIIITNRRRDGFTAML